MLVELYGIQKLDGCWEWRCTLDFETDRTAGFGLRGAKMGVIRFEPFLSMGLAFRLAEKLNGTCRWKVSLEKVRGELIQGCRELGKDGEFAARIRLVRVTAEMNKTASTSSRAPLDDRVLDRLIRILAGRFLLPEEVVSLMEASGMGAWKEDWRRYLQAGVCRGSVELVNGMEMRAMNSWRGASMEFICRRCGSSGRSMVWTACGDCGGMCPYCEACLTMGRIRRCSVLVRGVFARSKGAAEERTDSEDFMVRSPSCTSDAFPGESREDSEGLKAESRELRLSRWGLSPAQEAASAAGLRFLEDTRLKASNVSDRQDLPHHPPHFLIWAVTGAGKTEMIFPLVEHELNQGGRVLITTPRRDVVLELKPRIAKAFPGLKVVALYGGSKDRWEPGDITLSTTHQLMRFHRAFDLVIIDELDAFPYHNNPQLEFAARQVCSDRGRYVLLSATPPIRMQREVAKGRLPHVKVPVRYHRHPLPVPARLAIPPLEQMVKRGRLSGGLIRALRQSVERGAQVFVFVPKIMLVEPLVELLQKLFPDRAAAGTSSKDEDRSGKVMEFREKGIDILVTTTILERGVTVPKTDVFILGAESPLFDEASLVQMAGRAGRSKDDPWGRVYFASRDWTRSQAGAIVQIQRMNKLAKAKRYLIEGKFDGGSWLGRIIRLRVCGLSKAKVLDCAMSWIGRVCLRKGGK